MDVRPRKTRRESMWNMIVIVLKGDKRVNADQSQLYKNERGKAGPQD
jgi:hypothetical protein